MSIEVYKKVIPFLSEEVYKRVRVEPRSFLEFFPGLEFRFNVWCPLTPAMRFPISPAVLELNAFVKGAIEGFLSGLALLVFFAILTLVSFYFV